MTNIYKYLQKTLKEQNTNKINWKIVVLYFTVLIVYLLAMYLVAKISDIPSAQSPLSMFFYSIIQPTLNSLLLTLVGWFLAVKFLNVSRTILTIPAMINLFFFSKLTAWLVGFPIILIGPFVAMPLFLSANTGSFFTDFNISSLMTLYTWITELTYGTLIVTGIIFAVQAKNEKSDA